MDLSIKLGEIQSNVNGLAKRLQTLETQDKVGNLTAGSILFAGSTGSITQDNSNLFWDDTNNRLGLRTIAPSGVLHINFTGGSVTGLQIQDNLASGDVLLRLINPDNNIGSGSNWILAQTNATNYLQLRGDGFFGVYGPVNISDSGFVVPTKSALHIRNSDSYGIRVSASTTGGAMLQNPLTTNSSFARLFMGHNAIWNDSDSLWYIDPIGANDVEGIFIANGGPIEFILHTSTGNTARTMSMATFRGGAQLTINNAGVVNLAGGGPLQINGTQILTTRQTGWGTPTGTLSRATFDQSTVTLPQLAQRLAALVIDLRTHGVIGN